MESDFLYHQGLTREDASSFSGVRYVCIAGTNDRMTHFANSCGEKFGGESKHFWQAYQVCHLSSRPSSHLLTWHGRSFNLDPAS